ncbi:hypothetical protein DITRI_Ditri07aG0160900 [Diplodiscus trichospermus]
MSRRAVRQMLRYTRVSKALSPKSTKTLANYLRGAPQCAAGIIVASTFQAVFSPPGGVRQANENPTNMINGTYINTTVTNTTGRESSSNNAGKSVMDARIFLVFSVYNSLVLFTAIGIIGLLLSDGLVEVNQMFIVAYLLLCYAISIYVIPPNLVVATVDLLQLGLFIMFLISILALYN